MSRLLKAALYFKGTARILHYDQFNMNLPEVFLSACYYSAWASDSPPAGTEHSSAQNNAENKPLNNVNRDTRERERLTEMRSRMRMLHGLDRENPTHGTLSQFQNYSPDESTETDFTTPSLTSEPSDVVSSNIYATDDEGLSRTQSDFIRRLKDESLPKKKLDRFISAPFGLVRVDSMNSLQGRPKISKKSGETLGEIENVQKSSAKFGKSMIEHDRSDLKHSQSLLKPNESALKQDLPELESTELESKQDESELKYVQSEAKRSKPELRPNMSESHPELTIGQMHNNKTPRIRTRNKTASLPVSVPLSHAPLQHVPLKKTSKNPEPVETNMFDQQYFGRIADDQNQDAQIETRAFSSDNVFEEQYFSKSNNSSAEHNAQIPEEVFGLSASSAVQNVSKELTSPKRDLRALSYKSKELVDSDTDSKNLFDEQYFERTGQGQITETQKTTKRNKVRTAEVLPKSDERDEAEDSIFHEVVTKRETKQRSIPIANIENPTTAYDMAMKVRLERKGKLTTPPTATAGTHPRESKWSGRVDSKGFRILTEQVVDMQHLTEDVVLCVLRDSILYEDDNVIAIDKPYGLPSHGGPGVHHSVGKFLGPLAAKVDKTGQLTTLHLVHRLDKETTGVMVLAKSKQTAEFLLALFKKRMVVKRYWAITKGIPNPTEGVIDIPMAEGSVGDRYRMELRPVYRDEASFLRQATDSLSGERRDAVTNYKVLSSANGTALVECQPETGVKHQIRCHLAFGLNTPILGDHKYSHYSKMAPQRLYPEILQRLGVRQSKVRHLPMHLHAKALVLPEFRDGRNLFLSARLPKHFVQNMKWLKLEPPQ